MNKHIYLLGLYCICPLITISATNAAEPTASIEKLLPYQEADVELDSIDGDEFLTWASPTKVIFGNYYNSHVRDPSCETDKPHIECPKIAFDRHKVLMMFDIHSQKITFNIKNQFHQKQMRELERTLSNNYTECPYYKGLDKRARHKKLKAADGCLSEEGWIENDRITKKSTVFYVDANGKQTQIKESAAFESIPSWAWIDWFDAYILGTGISYDDNAEESETTITNFFSPQQRKLVPITARKGRFRISNIRLTRAGVIANTYSQSTSLESSAVTLWHGTKRYVIARSKNMLEVSPDGCHIAYLVRTKRVDEMRLGVLRDVVYSKLRVTNVCKAFNVKQDANPFSGITSLSTKQ